MSAQNCPMLLMDWWFAVFLDNTLCRACILWEKSAHYNDVFHRQYEAHQGVSGWRCDYFGRFGARPVDSRTIRLVFTLSCCPSA